MSPRVTILELGLRRTQSHVCKSRNVSMAQKRLTCMCGKAFSSRQTLSYHKLHSCVNNAPTMNHNTATSSLEAAVERMNQILEQLKFLVKRVNNIELKLRPCSRKVMIHRKKHATDDIYKGVNDGYPMAVAQKKK